MIFVLWGNWIEIKSIINRITFNHRIWLLTSWTNNKFVCFPTSPIVSSMSVAHVCNICCQIVEKRFVHNYFNLLFCLKHLLYCIIIDSELKIIIIMNTIMNINQQVISYLVTCSDSYLSVLIVRIESGRCVTQSRALGGDKASFCSGSD